MANKANFSLGHFTFLAYIVPCIDKVEIDL
jgi:hypothetical protein